MSKCRIRGPWYQTGAHTCTYKPSCKRLKCTMCEFQWEFPMYLQSTSPIHYGDLDNSIYQWYSLIRPCRSSNSWYMYSVYSTLYMYTRIYMYSSTCTVHVPYMYCSTLRGADWVEQYNSTVLSTALLSTCSRDPTVYTSSTLLCTLHVLLLVVVPTTCTAATWTGLDWTGLD